MISSDRKMAAKSKSEGAFTSGDAERSCSKAYEEIRAYLRQGLAKSFYLLRQGFKIYGPARKRLNFSVN